MRKFPNMKLVRTAFSCVLTPLDQLTIYFAGIAAGLFYCISFFKLEEHKAKWVAVCCY